ncbi:mercuric reductase [Niabella ginsengisoli]|uniref:Mercuric reductase n=1 Tax=Niabella ginsengisoli TaxID=522298 RepID=A0ABS9SKW7_9BACT|nr:mercuric reductase [Niabella ginsengisoli]MCH5598926.1 mercuric reductase [Niabella ginsengisoli]
MIHYDFIIIGSGQAGTPLAFNLAKKGKVAIIEKGQLGGTCVNNGCIPTKTYVASARKMWDISHGEEFGIDISQPAKANMQKIKQRKEAIIGEDRSGIEKGFLENENITLYRGEAHFASNYEIVVNGETLTSKNIFINVGSRPRVPDEYKHIPYFTNENLLKTTDLPEHLIIIGGSFIGVEFAQIFRRFGSKVTIVARGSRLIAVEDEDVSHEVAEILKSEKVDIIFNADDIQATENENGSITVVSNKEKTVSVTGSHVLLAIGMPNTDTLQLQNTDIQLNKRGFIEVDDYCQTDVAGIFAMGDCNGKGAFTHTSYHDYQVVESFLSGVKSRKISDRIITYSLFTDPPLGRVGMTKRQAIEKGYKVLLAHRPMDSINRAKVKGETKGFMQAIIDADTKLFLGACILGVGGDEIISALTNLMYAKQPYTVLRDAVHIHPTVSELLPTTLEDLKPLN